MRLVVVAFIIVAVPAYSRTIQGVLGDAQERVGLRPAPAFTNFAQHFATLATQPSLTSASSIALSGAGAIDSTMSMLGPIILDHADTLGAGTLNVNVLGERPYAQGSIFGQPFAELGQFGAPLVTRRTPTGNPTSPALLGINLRYAIDLHVWAAAIAVSYGVTDAFDASVVLPIVSTRLDCAVFAHVVAATGPNGGAFKHVPHTPTIGGTVQPVASTGIGDLAIRGKYKLPAPGWWKLALTMQAQFPTGDFAQLHGTGDYWLTPGVDLAYPFQIAGERWAEFDAHAGLDFDVNNSLRSQALYGAALSAAVVPHRLAAVVEFLGASQFDAAFAPHSTDALILTPSGAIEEGSLLGIDWSERTDQWNFSFGVRAALGHGIMLFANGIIALNDSGIRPGGVVPVFGIGGTF